MKVWIVTYGDSPTDQPIVGVFSKWELAEDWMQKQGNFSYLYDVDDWTVEGAED